MSEILQSEPSPRQLRDELEELARRDLLGPAGGPEEIVAEQAVRGRYIVGLLAPRNQTAFPDDPEDLTEDQTELAVAGEDTEDGVADSMVPQAVSMLPSAIGMTFTIDGDAKAIKITARWGRYERIDNPDGDTPRLVWKRIPVEGVSEPIKLVRGRFGPWSPCPDYEDVTVQGIIRRRKGMWTITLYLVNSQFEQKQNKDEAWVFQPELIVEAPSSAPIFLKRSQWRDSANVELEDQAMQMLYRKQVEFAVGHGVAVHAELADGEWDLAVRLTTSVIPSYEVPKTTPPTADDIPELADVVLDMNTLAETADADFEKAIRPLINAYQSWIDSQAERVANPSDDLAPYAEAAGHAMDNARKNLERIREGLELLSADSQAAEAFRFANRAMWQQRIHLLYAQSCRRGETVTLEDIDIPDNRRWYPFQLAFILLNLPSLTDVNHPDRSHQTQAVADLLWYPTGGGKTEAYLGLTAYTFGLRRLQGEIEGYSGAAGVAVLMRYTLRLLTLQQFQRATALICACESIRREAIETGDAKWGAEPFRIGLWIGQRSTPNRTEDSAEAIKQSRGQYSNAVARYGTPYQLTFCPWCGSEIQPGKHLHVETYGKGRCRTITIRKSTCSIH